MITTVVTFADLGLRCNVWGDPSCGHFARWTIQRRTEDNVTTNVLHACPTHLVDGLANALDLTGAQRWEARQQQALIRPDIGLVHDGDRPIRVKDEGAEGRRRLGSSS